MSFGANPFGSRAFGDPQQAAASGAYTLTAGNAAWQFAVQDATLRVARKLTAANAPWEFAAQNAGLTVARKIAAGNAPWQFAVQDATLTYAPHTGAYTLTAESAAWQFAVPDATLTLRRRGGGVSDKKKRRYIAKIGERLVVFDSADKALNAIKIDDREPDAPVVVPAKKTPPRLPKDAETVQAVQVKDIQTAARVYEQEQRVMDLFRRQRYAEMVALYQALRNQEDDDEIELLMLA